MSGNSLGFAAETSPSARDRVVVVGASVAGVRVARQLRQEGHAGSITLISAEAEVPYDRPPLSKQVLGETPSLPTLLTADEAAELDVNLLLGRRASSLDTTAEVVKFDDGRTVEYDSLVIATGLLPRSHPWRGMPGVHDLRTADDARALRRDLESAEHVCVVGAGFIGAEVAAACRARGINVSLIDPLELPTSRLFGTALAKRFQQLHVDNGTQTHLGASVDNIQSTPSGLIVSLTDLTTPIRVDAVVVGIGCLPEVSWLKGSGLQLDNGVVCDEYCRAVGTLNVYAAGDVARWFSPAAGAYRRVEHWTNAIEQATCVAHNIVRSSESRVYEPLPYVWSDQYDWKIQIVGETGEHLHCTIVEAPSGGFGGIWADENKRMVGAMSVNWPKLTVMARKLIPLGVGTEKLMASLGLQP